MKPLQLFHGLMFVNCLPQQHSTVGNDLAGNIPLEIAELTGLTLLDLGKYLILQRSNGAVEAFYSCFMD